MLRPNLHTSFPELSQPRRHYLDMTTGLLQRLDFRALWNEALPFDDFVAQATVNQALWQGIHRQARLPAWALGQAQAQAPRRWLVLAEDWCNDAVSVIPVLARLAEKVDGIELRILRRDEFPEVMGEYLGEDGVRAIPIVIVLNGRCQELGHWGSRPAPLAAWVAEHPDLDKPTRNLEARRWYARDRGHTTLREVLAVGATMGNREQRTGNGDEVSSEQ